MKKTNSMGAVKDIIVSPNNVIEYSYTPSQKPSAYQPDRRSFKFRKVTTEELKASRCSAYEYLIP